MFAKASTCNWLTPIRFRGGFGMVKLQLYRQLAISNPSYWPHRRRDVFRCRTYLTYPAKMVGSMVF